MKDVIAWELKRRRKIMFWWSLGTIIMTTMIVALYPSIRDQAAQMNQVINELPKGLREMKAGTAGTVNVGDPLQFLNSQLFYATLPIMWIILAITRGSSVLGREEQDKTLEILLSQPISRTRLLFAKAISLMIELLVVGAVCCVILIVLGPVFDLDIGASRIMGASLLTALFSLSFGYIAFALQAASSLTRRGATTIAVILSFGGYILVSLSGLTDWLDTPVKFFPYHYFAPLDTLEGHFPTGIVIYLVATFLIGTLLAIIGFRRRDIG